ncbi:MAG: sugar transferase [Anaerolineales bacterium]|nr:sugar transferase [Anaerolineales bacterium]
MRKALGLTPLSQLLLALDIALISLGLWLSSVVRLALPLGQEITAVGTALPWVVVGMAEVCWVSALAVWGAYDPRRILRWYQEVGRVSLGAATGSMLLAGMLYLTFREVSRLQFGYFFTISLVLLLLARAGLRLYHRARGKSRPGGRNRILIIGAGDLGQRAAQLLIDQSRWGYALAGFLDDDPAKAGVSYLGHAVLASVDDVAGVASDRKIDEVWVCLPGRSYERIQWVVAQLEKLPVRIKIAPDYFSLALVRARAEVMGGIPFIGLRDPILTGSQRAFKRLFDIMGALALLAILAIPMTASALAIRLNSAGPVLFRQKRVGENGRLFGMLKFRTMQADAEALQDQVLVKTADGQVIHKQPGDPRVTRVGRFLRRYSLDELPQLWNVVRGHMSLVGPRPEMPWLVDRYEGWQRKRFAVPQGVTGWWQVNGRSDKPMHLSTEDDLYYVYHYSIWLDIRILLMTPLAVLRGQGAF